MSAGSGPDAGPGQMPAELRERLARWLHEYQAEHARSWEQLSPSERVMGQMDADNLIAEIAASGHVIVDRDRLERIERVAINGRAYCRGLGQYGDLVAAVNTLRPGDLDPVEPGAGR